MSVAADIDPRRFGKVAVLMGGHSAEREISLLSGTGVLNALRARGVDAHAFDPAQRPLDDLQRDGYARCYIALHGRHGEDGTVQGALEILGLPYTGSGVMASAIGLDKIMTKRIWRFEGIPTPRWCAVDSPAQTRAALLSLGAPMIVKPAREGSTLGLTKVEDEAACEAAYALAARHDRQVLAEEFILGEELTIPVLADQQGVRAMPVVRIIAPDGNYDYQNKYFTDDTRYLCPSGLDSAAEQQVQDLAVRAFELLGCRSCARVDVMLGRDAQGGLRPCLLEINTSPGMTTHSLVPMSARVMGWDFDELCLRILATAELDGGAVA